jgi:UDPglucose 6-dehydrogenase
LKAKNIQLYYQVETLIFGAAVHRALYPERFMVGCANPGHTLPPAYAELLGAFRCPILPMRYESAELAKIAINIFLTASVTATNTLAEVCEHIGADWSEIVPALQLDKRIGPHAYLSPGLGIAGGNLERDLVTVQSLAAEHGTDAQLIAAFRNLSDYRRTWALRTLHEYLPSGKTPVVAVWGLAYKPNTHSTKNSPSLALVQALQGMTVRAYDPQVKLDNVPGVSFVPCPGPIEACAGADALVVMTPWGEFKSLDLTQLARRMPGRVVIDPFGCLDALRAEQLGLTYRKLGFSLPERSAA